MNTMRTLQKKIHNLQPKCKITKEEHRKCQNTNK